MRITKNTIEEILQAKVEVSKEYAHLGLVNSDINETLTFIDGQNYLDELNSNANIAGVFITEKLAKRVTRQETDILITEDPRYDFYLIYNELAKRSYKELPSAIDASANIHPTAFVSETNVTIGKNTVIEPNATVLGNVEIGNEVIIRAGSTLGVEGFEHKRTSKGILSVFHAGKVIIGDHVEIGANNAISKGFVERNTIVGDHTKTDSLVHIAHGVQIGKRCFLPAACMIAGSSTIEDDVWIGPNASVSSQISIGKGAYITLGAVVTKDVAAGEHVSGNFAIPHKKFMQIFKRNLDGS